MKLFTNTGLFLCRFWYNYIIFRYMVALVGWAKADYKNSWKFKERWQVVGLDYAQDYEAHVSDIQYHMHQCPKYVKFRLFLDAYVFFTPLNDIPYYISE